MSFKEIVTGVYSVGVTDPDRRMFDELIELPNGTSYNSYIVQGSEKTVLIDTVDPDKQSEFFQNIADSGIESFDDIVVNHAEQDHSGLLPEMINRYPDVKVVTNKKSQDILINLMPLDEKDFIIIEDGQTLDIGGRTLEFIITPWVHWPETMLTYLKEDQMLFSCDLFGSHLPVVDNFVVDRKEIEIPAKRYYAEIMMPFRNHVTKHLKRLEDISIKMICPSHGPMYDQPQIIMDLYQEWVSDDVKNKAIVVYISMHNSIKQAVDILVAELKQKQVEVKVYNLAKFDSGELAMDVLDAATVVIATPTVLGGVHPKILYGATLLNLLRIKSRYAAVINSYSWGGKAVDQIKAAVSNLKIELLEPVMIKGYPKEENKKDLLSLADNIVENHKNLKEV